jgi:hypothetical protein
MTQDERVTWPLPFRRKSIRKNKKKAHVSKSHITKSKRMGEVCRWSFGLSFVTDVCHISDSHSVRHTYLGDLGVVGARGQIGYRDPQRWRGRRALRR